MLWKDFKDTYECDSCPLLKSEICTGGFRCYGGEPIEPPCCSFDDDMDMDRWVMDHYNRQRLREERESKRLQEEAKKKERAKKAADTRRAMRRYCWDELYSLNRAKKALQAQRAAEHFARSFAEAVNITNEMFRYEERMQVRPELSAEIKRLEAEVVSAEKKYQSKRKEFYTKRKLAQNVAAETGGDDT